MSQRRTNLSQVHQYLRGGTQDDSGSFRRLSKDTTVKIILHLILRPSLSQNDEYNSTLEDQYGKERQYFAHSFQNDRLPDST